MDSNKIAYHDVVNLISHFCLLIRMVLENILYNEILIISREPISVAVTRRINRNCMMNIQEKTILPCNQDDIIKYSKMCKTNRSHIILLSGKENTACSTHGLGNYLVFSILFYFVLSLKLNSWVVIVKLGLSKGPGRPKLTWVSYITI